MAYYLEQWDSLSAFLDHIASSGTQVLRPNKSFANDPGFAGEADVPTFIQQCRTLSRPDFPDRAATIDRLAETLTGELPAGVTLRRHRAWGPSGTTVNVQRVLRGNLGQAWRRTVRQQARTSDGGSLVVLVRASISGSASAQQIFWSAVATLALADYARRRGYRVALWSLGLTDDVHQDAPGYAWLVPLVREGESWDSSAVCMTTYLEWNRRLGHRVKEMAVRHCGPLIGHYGATVDRAATLAWARQTWAPTQGLAPASLVLGCTQDDDVSTADAAERWVRAQLTGLAEAA